MNRIKRMISPTVMKIQFFRNGMITQLMLLCLKDIRKRLCQ